MTYTYEVPKQTTKEARVAARLTTNGKGLLVAAAEKLGVSESAVIEMAIREFAASRGIRAASGASMTAEQKAEYTTDTGQG